eukprot:Gregarina_sp_Poly_1__421@NODE_1101_length_5098_cov_110_751342_g763_i0_p2_GENE_NODE_1101_length_5098_cov_110_751342_g763_i0NODE_1101_length_5098_cov_110_751342_g763_i0_p2_ORF_typecomplete_len456_score52_82KAR9/PF08580_10/2_5_NODE_1101_length_5098_cov_110_751342_g763_i034924859
MQFQRAASTTRRTPPRADQRLPPVADSPASTRAKSSPGLTPKVLERAQSRVSEAPRTPPNAQWELGSPVRIRVWSEIAFGKSGRSPNGRQDPPRTPMVVGKSRNWLARQSSAASVLSTSPATSRSKVRKSRHASPSPTATSPSPAPALSPKSTSPHPPGATTDEFRILRQGVQVRVDDEDCFRGVAGWVGFIEKKKRGVSAGTLSPCRVDIGINGLRHIALTGKQWAYAVAVKDGDLHVCALNIALGYGLAMQHIRENFRRLRQEAKIEGFWPRCRVVTEFAPEALCCWLCTHGATQKSMSRHWSLKDMGAAPTRGLIRQDLTWSISPFRSVLSEATGLKGSFLPVSKFAKGYKRWVTSGHSLSAQNGRVPVYATLELSAFTETWRAKLRAATSTTEITVTAKDVTVQESEMLHSQRFESSDVGSRGSVSVDAAIAHSDCIKTLLVEDALRKVPG